MVAHGRGRDFILGPARVAIGDGTVTESRIVIRNGRVEDLLEPSGHADLHLPEGSVIAPGLIDVHTNGADDALFNRDQGAAVEVAAHAYARAGATGFVASIMTAPWESMLHAASEVAEAAHSLEEQPETIGARCLGIHFEGPFLNPKYRGVHRGDWVTTPTIERVRAALEATRGALVMVTMAPEVDGSAEAARLLCDQGVICSAGHTAARYRDGLLAIGIGYRSITHAFNAMPPLDHRDPSLLVAFVQEDRTWIQMIVDGYHVAPTMVDLLYRAVGPRLVLATDNMPPAGSGYRVEGGVMRSEDGTIAGSALQPDTAIRNLMAYARIPFERAIVNGSAAPARLLGLESDMGTIAKGKRADFSVWDERTQVVATFVGGVPVHGSNVLIPELTSAS